MILLVCGRLKDEAALERCLDDIHRDYHIDMLIEGGEDYGVDEAARLYARSRGIPNKSFHVKVKGRMSRAIRNYQMIEQGKPNLLVVSSSLDQSAQQLVSIAKKRNIPVRYMRS